MTPPRPTAAKGGFPYPHLHCAEWQYVGAELYTFADWGREVRIDRHNVVPIKPARKAA